MFIGCYCYCQIGNHTIPLVDVFSCSVVYLLLLFVISIHTFFFALNKNKACTYLITHSFFFWFVVCIRKCICIKKKSNQSFNDDGWTKKKQQQNWFNNKWIRNNSSSSSNNGIKMPDDPIWYSLVVVSLCFSVWLLS